MSCRDCPEDLKEAISSSVFAAPRSSDLPELMAARQIFGLKYGKEFILAAEELRPGCCVNRRVSAAFLRRLKMSLVSCGILMEQHQPTAFTTEHPGGRGVEARVLRE